MTGAVEHVCQYRTVLLWSPWKTRGQTREREGRRVARCRYCSQDRAVRRARPPTFLEREASEPQSPVADRVTRETAYKALKALRARAPDKRSDVSIKVKGLVGAMRREGVNASDTEPTIELLVSAGLLRGRFRLKGAGRVLESVTVVDANRLEDFARPGARQARLAAAAAALSAVEVLTHPIAVEAKRALSDPEQLMRMSPLLIRALAAVCLHTARGDVMSERVFSAHHLGGSKDLRRVRTKVERVLGPLEQLGIREGAVLQLLGRRGAVVAGGARVPLDGLGAFVGFTRECLASATFEFPIDGLVVVENLAVFEACCRGEVDGVGDAMVAWSAGYPGYGTRRVVESAAAAGAKVRIWSDLDLDGVRITRLLASWALGLATPWRMSPADFMAARSRKRLGPRLRNAIAAELGAQPNGLLAELLRQLLEAGAWVEQEIFLHR